MYIYDVSLKYY